jgi:hypothetical protein
MTMPQAQAPDAPALTSSGTGAADDSPHVLSAACPLHCLKDALSTRAFNALDRTISARSGGHPTVGHVLDMRQRRELDGVRGLGVQGLDQISTALAGLPAPPAPAVTLPSLAEVRAEHPGWQIEPTRGYKTFGYTATSHTDPADVIRTGTLSEMQRTLRQTRQPSLTDHGHHG